MTDSERSRAFETLLDEAESMVWTLCRRMTGSEALARDACQESWLAVWRALPGFRGEAKATSWIWRIAVRATLDLLRREKRQPEGLLEDAPEPRAPGLDPSDRLEQEDLRHRLLEGLTPRQRALVHLRYTEELSYEEIADALGVGLSSVKVGLHRAKAAMRSRMETLQRAPAPASAGGER